LSGEDYLPVVGNPIALETVIWSSTWWTTNSSFATPRLRNSLIRRSREQKRKLREQIVNIYGPNWKLNGRIGKPNGQSKKPGGQSKKLSELTEKPDEPAQPRRSWRD
jgi:hypothetical protein